MNDPTIIPVTIVFLILVTAAIVMGLNKVSYIMVLSYILYILVSWLSSFNHDTEYVIETVPEPMPAATMTEPPDTINHAESEVPVETVSLNDEQATDTLRTEYQYYIPIRLNNLILTSGIDYRDPVDTMNVFHDSTEYIYCFTAVENQNPYTVPVYHEWRYEGVFFSKVRITVGKSYNWRCWSRISNAGEWTGSWQVIVSDSLDAVLDTIRFKVSSKKSNDLIRVP